MICLRIFYTKTQKINGQLEQSYVLQSYAVVGINESYLKS